MATGGAVIKPMHESQSNDSLRRQNKVLVKYIDQVEARRLKEAQIEEIAKQLDPNSTKSGRQLLNEQEARESERSWQALCALCAGVKYYTWDSEPFGISNGGKKIIGAAVLGVLAYKVGCFIAEQGYVPRMKNYLKCKKIAVDQESVRAEQ